MTDGGLRADGTWQRLGYLPYDLLHRTWQTHVLQMIATRLASDAQAQRLVVEMQRRYPKGFVAYLQGDVRHRMKRLARYLAKYVISPPMALSRIVAYDREHGTVTYWYRDHRRGGKRTEETVSRATFIGPLVQHILPKGFQRIRSYGLQATCILKQVREQLAVALPIVVQQVLDMVGAPLKQRGCSRAAAGDVGVRSAGVSALWWGHVVVADLASAVWRDL